MGVPLFGQEHADRYREIDGERGHDWQGTTVLLLTTIGRNSGAKRITPLIHQRHGDGYLVVASNGGGDPPYRDTAPLSDGSGHPDALLEAFAEDEEEAPEPQVASRPLGPPDAGADIRPPTRRDHRPRNPRTYRC